MQNQAPPQAEALQAPKEPTFLIRSWILGEISRRISAVKCALCNVGREPKASLFVATNTRKNPPSTPSRENSMSGSGSASPKDDPAADDAFAYEQELSGTDSPIDIVEPPVASPAPVPTAASVKTPAAGKRVIMAIFSALSLGVYRWLQLTISPVGKVRIAVLPFTYVSGDSKPDYITDGLTDIIRTALSQLDPQHLGVIAATSSKIVAGKPITEIGRVLNVRYVLEGSVQRGGNQ